MLEVQKGRRALERLSLSGEYVFHGSADADIEEFVPASLQSKSESDGAQIYGSDEKNVFATRYIDVAIFAAVVFRRMGRSGWYSNEVNGVVTFTFNADEEAKRSARSATGYVYVLPAKKFNVSRFTPIELVSSTRVKPLFVVEVTADDLNPSLDTLESDPDIHH